MLLTRRSVTLGTVAGAAAAALAPDALSATALGATGSSTDDSQVVLDWERIVFRTVYTDTLTPVPVGVPVLGFVAVAVHRAAVESAHVGASSETAAVATAAHDVLVHYYPTLAAQLAADLANSLTGIGRARRGQGDADRGRGGRRLDRLPRRRPLPRLVVPLLEGAGPGRVAAQPRLHRHAGALARITSSVVLSTPVPRVGSARPRLERLRDASTTRYAGSARSSSAERTPHQTDTALFLNSNSATMVSDALSGTWRTEPLDLLRDRTPLRDDPRRAD